MKPFFVVCMLLAWIQPALADQWISPRETKVSSANKRFVATVTPSDNLGYQGDDRTASLILEDKADGAKPQTVATIKLVNMWMPVTVFVSDDGHSIITLDDWGQIGEGPNVMTFYHDGKLIQNYSRRDLVAQGVPEPIVRSTSSVDWRGVACGLDTVAGRPVLKMYFTETKRWMMWDAQTGKPADPVKAIAERWSDEIRQHAAEDVQKGDFYLFSVLNSLHQPKDKAVISSLLSGGNWLGSASVNPFKIEIANAPRGYAERCLSKWDEATPGAQAWTTPFGSIHAIIHLAAPPATDNEDLDVYLIPESAAESGWRGADAYARSTTWLYMKNKPGVGQDADFEMSSLDPGKYWIKVVHFTEPLANSDKTRGPAISDYESKGKTVFEVKRGQITAVPPVICVTENGI